MKLGLSKERLYKAMEIALVVALVISGGLLLYGHYVSTQPFRVLQVQGFLSVYKNGKLVYQGPDVLTNSFYEYLPFLLGNVCALATFDAPESCTPGNWADNVFTAPPQPPSCSVYISGTEITEAPRRVPVIGDMYPYPRLYGGLGTGTTASPSDCVLHPLAYDYVTTVAFSPYLYGGYVEPPCPSPTHGCVLLAFGAWGPLPSPITDVMLYAAYSIADRTALYTLIAHDVIPPITVGENELLHIFYYFVFPSVQTDAVAYYEDQGAIAALFGQCLGRKYFQIGIWPNRLCLDPVLVSVASLNVYTPANPCSDTSRPTSFVSRGGKITIEANAAGKYVRIYAPMSAAGRGLQMAVYSITPAHSTSIDMLKATQSCALATTRSFVAGQTVGLQLNFP